MESVLEIFTNWFTPEERQALAMAEQMYQALGSPVDKEALDRTLEKILDECRRRHVRYPAALLKRKAQMQRGEFLPAVPMPPAEHISRGPVVSCLDCRGEYDGMAKPEAWLRLHACSKQPVKAQPDVPARKKAGA